MGKVTGFLETDRAPAPRRPRQLRVLDWREVEAEHDVDEAKQQAGRCMDCGVPFCTQGCPLGNPIPEFNHRVWRGDDYAAWQRLAATNNFPELTGRLCPAPCEASCVLAIDDDVLGRAGAVTIEHIERHLADHAFAAGWIAPAPCAPSSGKHVGVVGSGPAGLAAAQQLRRAGHAVTVYEAADRPGGLCRYGIPDFKLERGVLDQRLAQLLAEGVAFRCGVTVGSSPTWNQLSASHDAVVIAIGSRRPRELDIPGRHSLGVIQAMDYLEAGNRVVANNSTTHDPLLDVKGHDVVILGGGDTGSDCLGTALRQGARSVQQIELLEAPSLTRVAGNPWPQWPLVFRTSSSQEEGGQRVFGLQTTHLEHTDGQLRALVARHVELVDGELVVLDRPAVTIAATRVILALGFSGPLADELGQQLSVARDPRGNVIVDGNFATNSPGVFAAGDAHRGASLIVWAIAEGRQCASAVDAFLRAS